MGSQKNTPPSTNSPKNSKTLHELFVLEKPLSPIQTSPTLSMNEELLSAISYCTYVFTFTDPLESPAQRDSKRLQLTRLISVLKSSKKPVHEKVLGPLVSMISANLFRPLPPPANPSAISDLAEEEDPISIFSPIWSHLQIVYEILLRLVITTDHEVLRKYIDNSFLLKLLALFQSEDPRERESLKNAYHKIYSKFIPDRSFMRKSMKDVLLNHVFETERHPGIAELLEIWGTIINGFTVPLKEEHKLFLMRVLIPLHKAKGMQVYHRQLAYCVSQFVQKEPMLGGVVVRGILRYWPVTNTQKEILLIGELEDLVENIDPDQYRKLALPLCTQITKCINSWNSQVNLLLISIIESAENFIYTSFVLYILQHKTVRNLVSVDSKTKLALLFLYGKHPLPPTKTQKKKTLLLFGSCLLMKGFLGISILKHKATSKLDYFAIFLYLFYCHLSVF